VHPVGHNGCIARECRQAHLGDKDCVGAGSTLQYECITGRRTWVTKMAWERLLRALPLVRSVLRRKEAPSSLCCRGKGRRSSNAW
jgi:hypothetical protein